MARFFRKKYYLLETWNFNYNNNNKNTKNNNNKSNKYNHRRQK
jgi:hypothetical protein